MRKKILSIMLSLVCCATLFTACGNETNIVENETIEETDNDEIIAELGDDVESGDATSTEITDPNVEFTDGTFVLYKDGRNNVTDSLDGYGRTFNIPEEYDNYETLLNHALDYKATYDKMYVSDYVEFHNCAIYKGAAEIRYKIGNYTMHTIWPLTLTDTFTDPNSIYTLSKYNYDEETGELSIYASVFNIETSSLYLTSLKNYYGEYSGLEAHIAPYKNNDIQSLLPTIREYVDVTSDSKYEFTTQDNYVIVTITGTLKKTLTESPYLEKDVPGVFSIICDTSDGTTISNFVGFGDDTLLNEIYASEIENATINQYSLEVFCDSVQGTLKIKKD